jgi:carboxypeptidase Q
MIALSILTALSAPTVADDDTHSSTLSPIGPEQISKHYTEAATRIIDATLAGNDAWSKLEELCDDIGHRLSGSPALERAVEWAVDRLKKDGQENVHAEKVMVTQWVRGGESLVMIEPRRIRLAMLGLGGSVGTSPDGITASVISVSGEEELDALGQAAKGKIVLFDNPMPPYDPKKGAGYGSTVRFRGKGPRIAAEKGAVACLIRSVTAHSLYSPHTGATHYGDAKVKIPAAAISTEDASMISRLLARGKDVKVALNMEARTAPEKVPSANVVAELRGSTWPDEIVVIGGHLDSWDVGQGAHDDGGGCVTAMEAINVLRRLGKVPRRTIRVVLFTNEENGLRGGRQYAKDHADELAKHVAAIEMDSGVFGPLGFGLGCKDKNRQEIAVAQLQEILRLLEPIGATQARTGGGGPDIGPMSSAGVILMGLRVEGSKYFDTHHTQADTLDKVDPKTLSQCVAAMAVTAYVIADMPTRLGESVAD